MSDEPKTLFGFPVVEADTMPVGTVVFGPMPTWFDLQLYGSWENYLDAKRKEFGVITNLFEDD